MPQTQMSSSPFRNKMLVGVTLGITSSHFFCSVAFISQYVINNDRKHFSLIFYILADMYLPVIVGMKSL